MKAPGEKIQATWDGKEIDWIETWKLRAKGYRFVVVVKNESGKHETINMK